MRSFDIIDADGHVYERDHDLFEYLEEPYVACQTNDDLPYIMKYVGEDNLVMGTDYSHTDSSAELEALQRLKHDARLSFEARRKILDDNARALYGL